MKSTERHKIFRQIMWDYNIAPEEIEAVLKGEKDSVGHYTRETLFVKLIESYSWFTIIQLFSIEEIQSLLTYQAINKLRSPSLRKKYEFVRKRLQENIHTSG